jgi:hypothetical protein
LLSHQVQTPTHTIRIPQRPPNIAPHSTLFNAFGAVVITDVFGGWRQEGLALYRVIAVLKYWGISVQRL